MGKLSKVLQVLPVISHEEAKLLSFGIRYHLLGNHHFKYYIFTAWDRIIATLTRKLCGMHCTKYYLIMPLIQILKYGQICHCSECNLFWFAPTKFILLCEKNLPPLHVDHELYVSTKPLEIKHSFIETVAFMLFPCWNNCPMFATLFIHMWTFRMISKFSLKALLGNGLNHMVKSQNFSAWYAFGKKKKNNQIISRQMF